MDLCTMFPQVNVERVLHLMEYQDVSRSWQFFTWYVSFSGQDCGEGIFRLLIASTIFCIGFLKWVSRKDWMTKRGYA